MSRAIASLIGFWAGGMLAATTFSAVSSTLRPLDAATVYIYVFFGGCVGAIAGAASHGTR